MKYPTAASARIVRAARAVVEILEGRQLLSVTDPTGTTVTQAGTIAAAQSTTLAQPSIIATNPANGATASGTQKHAPQRCNC